MFAKFKKIFSIQDLKKKILFTFFILALCRIGSFIPVPGINGSVTLDIFKNTLGAGQNLFQLMDVFSGGAFAQMTIFALGVMPYISSSIILQLLVALVPSLQREVKENQEIGRRKLGKWTRTLTIFLAIFQSILYAKYAIQLNASNPGIIIPYFSDATIFGIHILFYMVFVFSLSTGSVLLMWLGEQISERGVGNGISLIISLGILSSFPRTVGNIINQLNIDSQQHGSLSFLSLSVLLFLFVLIVVGTILVIQGQRKIHLEYARKTSDSSSTATSPFIPLKVNYAGVVPVIFASSILMFPATIAQFLSKNPTFASLTQLLSPGSFTYSILYISLIIFFTYFWTATQFRPDQIASDMKKSGAFIPGVRQGKPTQDYLEFTMGKITFLGATFLALIAISPTLIGNILKVDQNIAYFFGGTSLLILVGVVLDTTKQVESHLLMKKYEGFMKRGRLR